MKLKPCFEIIDVAGEYMAIPIGDHANTFGGIIALSETAAFLLKQMNVHRTKEELTNLLIHNYVIDMESAKINIESALELFTDLGLIEK